MHPFSRAQPWLSPASREPSEPARRDAFNLVASPSQLPDLLSGSCSGDAADQQPRVLFRAVTAQVLSPAWISFVLRLADGDSSPSVG